MDDGRKARANGYNGSRSLQNPSSLLAKVVVYVVTVTQSGDRATRRGFARGRMKKGKRYAADVFQYAEAEGIIKFSGEREHGYKVYVPGDVAKVATHLALLG